MNQLHHLQRGLSWFSSSSVAAEPSGTIPPPPCRVVPAGFQPPASVSVFFGRVDVNYLAAFAGSCSFFDLYQRIVGVVSLRCPLGVTASVCHSFVTSVGPTSPHCCSGNTDDDWTVIGSHACTKGRRVSEAHCNLCSVALLSVFHLPVVVGDDPYLRGVNWVSNGARGSSSVHSDEAPLNLLLRPHFRA